MPVDPPFNQITYLILAGGRGQRMQGVDKGLMLWQDKPMIEHVIKHLDVPFNQLIISANRNESIYEKYAHQIIGDDSSSTDGHCKKAYLGPLAGILSAMNICTTEYLLCVPCDSPCPPAYLLNDLWHCLQQQNKKSAVCHDGERLQPLFCLLPRQHKTLLANFLQQGQRKVHDFFNLIEPAICDFSKQKNRFHNFNHPDDIN